MSCSAACGYSIEWEDSVAEWVKLVESSVEEHSAGCGDALGFLAPPPGSSIMAMCQWSKRPIFRTFLVGKTVRIRLDE